MTETRHPNFLTEVIDADRAAGRVRGPVVTRFPPEPNGYLHIGHAKSICLNFGLAKDYGGRCHLRYDDTNPTTEDVSYVQAIEADVRWLGFDWGEHLHYASDYFERMWECAVRLVRDGKAYVDSQTVEQIREGRGSFDRPGTNSPYRDRPPDENLALLRRMRAGELADGSSVLRARIDMAHPNVLLRDPLLYRIRHARHHRTGDAWCIYPMYDYAHPLEDAFEGVTHSICTLEFESNRELYDWVLDNLGPWDPRPRQYEFARLSLGYTLMSKRKLLQLVTEKHVSGWDDPRMPTIAGLRRRGVTAEALREFAALIGVAKNNSVVDIGKLEFAIRQDLEARAPRAMAVLEPLPVTITDWPAEKVEELEVPWWPGEPARAGVRKVPFGRELFVEREDFSEAPPKDWKRLAPGREVRLLGGYFVRCTGVEKDPATGAVTRLTCTHDPATRGGAAPDGRKPQGSLHWVSAARGLRSDVRLYDRLFAVEMPEGDPAVDFRTHLNPHSLVTRNAVLEPALAAAPAGSHHQFVRQGYFFADPVDSRPGAPVFNRVITLRDAWASRAAAPAAEAPRSERPETARDAAAAAKKAAAPKKTRSEGRAELRAATPELAERFKRYQDAWKLSEGDAALLTGDLARARFFDAAVAAHPSAASVARWLVNDLLAAVKDRDLATLPLDGAGFGRFVALVDADKVSAGAAKTLLAHLVEKGGDPEKLVEELGLQKVEDPGAVARAIDAVLAAHGTEVARYRAGETKLFGVLLGAAMKATRGAADPALVRKVLVERLG